MQKENPVIKNYILSSKKRVLDENPPLKSSPICSEILLYHLLSEQNTVYFYFFPL